MKTGTPNQRRHLSAAALALGLAALAVTAGIFYCHRIEERYVHELAPDLSDAKLQGVVLQEEAFAQPDLLVLYGSSELVKEMPNNAVQFFQDYPTGFRVFPVGQPGVTSLAVLQRVAAVGENIRGKKVAFSISPGWFFTESFDPAWYEGNFSHLQAYELAFNSELSPGLTRDIARRMLDYPKTLQNHWLLEFGLKRLARGTMFDRVLYAAAWPLGRTQTAIGRMQDHLEASLHILAEDAKLSAPERRGLRALNWNDLLKRAAQFTVNNTALRDKQRELAKNKQKLAHENKALQTEKFLTKVGKAREWTDLELLLRSFRELGADPLLLSMPVEDIRLEVYGVSDKARTTYLRRLDTLADRYDVPLLDFRDQSRNPTFMVDFLDHLSPQGWVYYNKALDDFYHERVN